MKDLTVGWFSFLRVAGFCKVAGIDRASIWKAVCSLRSKYGESCSMVEALMKELTTTEGAKTVLGLVRAVIPLDILAMKPSEIIEEGVLANLPSDVVEEISEFVRGFCSEQESLSDVLRFIDSDDEVLSHLVHHVRRKVNVRFPSAVACRHCDFVFLKPANPDTVALCPDCGLPHI